MSSRGAVLTLVAVLLLRTGAAAEDLRFEASAIAATAAAVRAKEAATDQAGERALELRWIQECGWYRERGPNCFLSGPGDTVLLFRGERGEHPSFMIAPVLRWDVARSGLCGAECALSNLPEALLRLYASLAAHDFELESSLRYLYDFPTRSWSGYRVGSSATFPLSSLPRVSDPRSSIRAYTPAQLMVTTHVMEEHVNLVDAGGTRRALDPMVSFSASPMAAAGFAQDGRLIVLAVPRERFLPASAGCPATLVPRGRFLDVRACPRTHRDDMEDEYDASLFVDADLVHAVYRR